MVHVREQRHSTLPIDADGILRGRRFPPRLPDRTSNVPDQESHDRGLAVEPVPVLQGAKAG